MTKKEYNILYEQIKSEEVYEFSSEADFFIQK